MKLAIATLLALTAVAFTQSKPLDPCASLLADLSEMDPNDSAQFLEACNEALNEGYFKVFAAQYRYRDAVANQDKGTKQ